MRAKIARAGSSSLQESAEHFAELFSAFPSVALSRVFIVLPFESMPPGERSIVEDRVGVDQRLKPQTKVLSLLATRGHESDWNDRERSNGHRAIPLLDRSFVQGAPMIAALLAALDVDLQALDDGRANATRPMLGSRNTAFYVADARDAKDQLGRLIIPDQDFVARHAIRTVFGMGGAYVHDELAIAIAFCRESLDRLVVDRFPSLISNFKMATAALLDARKIYRG